MENVKGFKVTDKNMQCRGYQYELNKEFTAQGKVLCCSNGFHFCEKADDCFNYYDFDSTNRVFEIEASGVIDTDGDKSCAKKIRLTRELTWHEVLEAVNTGKDNTGRSNSGNSNSGDSNSGDSNSGDSNSGDSNSGNRNSGDRNSGYRNSGDRNSGYRNSGYRNSGYRNSGNWNSGNSNSGNSNSGDSNSGDSNSGDSNSGDSNSGNRNSGNCNSGDRNSGDSNSGDSNSGNWNSGNSNSGDSNSGYRNSGAFCTDLNPTIWLFNKPSKILVRDWEKSKAYRIMSEFLDPTIWIWEANMNDEEKKNNPSYKITGGYLKTISLKEAWQNMWPNLSDENKKEFTSLPNFSAKIFKEITGIKI